MPPMPTPLLDHDAITADVLARVAARAPQLETLAGRHLARLSPDRWTIEWHLPAWLGHRFVLDGGFVDAMVRANVLGLLSIRLEDDLDDREVPDDEVARTRALAGLAFDGAIAEYRSRFPGNSPIWAFLRRSMIEWRAGASGHDLVARGGPMKIAAYACCLHADRLDLWPPLDRCLDRAVTALVLYDQHFDWDSDLEAGRWNAFVAGITNAEQVPERRERNRAAVLAAMLTRPAVEDHFEATDRAASEGASLARELGIAELAEFLTTWAARSSRQGAEIAEHYRRVGDRATSLIFGTRVGGAAT